MNIINNLHVGINKLSSLRSNNLAEFRWYKDIYFTILGLKRFSLELSPLGLKINLEDISTISKIERVIFFSRPELIRDQSIKSHKRKGKNYLYNLKNLGHKFGSQMSKLYKKNIKSKRKFDKRIRKIPKKLNEKWICDTLFKLNDGYYFRHEALLDSGSDINCIRQDLIPSRYFERFNQNLQTIEGRNLRVNHKISELYVCIGKYCIKMPFLLIKTLKQGVILGNPFLAHLKPFTVTEKEIITQGNQRILFKTCYNSREFSKYVQ